MNTTKRIVMGCALLVTMMLVRSDATADEAPVVLGSAATFAVLAGSTVTNTGDTIVDGDLGVSPGTAVTGFVAVDGGPGIVNGTIYNGTPGPAASAQGDLTIAFNDAAGRTVGAITIAGNLGGQTLTPGLYKSTSSLEISSGDLTLDAQGDANAVFIFQIASTLTTTAGRQVILSGGAQSANVFWQVGSSATLGTGSVFAGTIMADQSITLTTGAMLEGQALARMGAVTLDTNTIAPSATTTTLPATTTTTTVAEPTTTTTTLAESICGDVVDDDDILASDALGVLRAAVSIADCALCVCDVDASGGVMASDALVVLRLAVGLPGLPLNCPAC